MAKADLKDRIGHEPIGINAHYALLSKDVLEFNAPAFVTIPDFDLHEEWGPCRWQTRDDVTLPHRGNQCLVVFDNRRQPWIIVWWPF